MTETSPRARRRVRYSRLGGSWLALPMLLALGLAWLVAAHGQEAAWRLAMLGLLWLYAALSIIVPTTAFEVDEKAIHVGKQAPFPLAELTEVRVHFRRFTLVTEREGCVERFTWGACPLIQLSPISALRELAADRDARFSVQLFRMPL